MSWQEIWEKRTSTFATMDKSNIEAVFLELKRAIGYDIVKNDKGTSFLDWIDAYREHSKYLCLRGGDSLYEVGCGSGANLFLFARDGIRVGGADYSHALVTLMREVFQSYHITPLECDVLEAKATPTELKYDVVFLDGIAHYFPDYDYAQETLQRMLVKANHTMAWLGVHDKAKEKAFYVAREKIDPDYQKHYEGLPKLFYFKTFFLDFAEENHLDVLFTPCPLKGYWNGPFAYNVYFYKRHKN